MWKNSATIPPIIKRYGVWVVIVIAVLLRLPLLAGSFWLDEAAQALEIIRPLREQFNIIEDFQPPLLHLYLYLVQHFSHREWWLRLWGALLPSIASIYIVFKIGQRLQNFRVGLLTIVLLSTSSFHIFYSQELRPYALPAFLATFSWWLLVQEIAQKKVLTGKFFFGFSVVTFLGLYSSYLYPFLLLSQLVYIFWRQKHYIKQFLFSVSLAIVGFLPWLPLLSLQLAAGEAVRRSIPGWDQVVSVSQAKSILLVIAKFLFGVVNVEINLWFVSVTTLIGSTFIYLLWQQRKKFTHLQQILLTWLVIPLSSSWLFSFFIPVIQPKRLLFLLPALYLLVADLAVTNSHKENQIGHRIIAGVLILSLLLTNIVGTIQYYVNPHFQRENWRALHQEISSRFNPETTILVFAFPEPFAPWIWYDQGTFPTLTTGRLNTSQSRDLATTFKTVSDYEFVLVFDYLRDLTDSQNKIPNTLKGFGYEERGVLDYPLIGFVRIYARSGSATATTSLQ